MRHTLFFALLFLASELLANVAQPGIWQAGGAGAFTPLFPEDSVAFRQVQMVDEQVCIQLYPGFAVVRGEYQLLNTSDSTATFRMGYPLNGIIDRSETYYGNEIVLDSLHHFSLLIDGNPVETEFFGDDGPGYGSPSKWHYWPVSIPDGEALDLVVYFLVNTNEASILSGYDRDHYNAFIYLIESGITWQPPILRGDIRIQMMNELGLDDIHGLERSERFMTHPDQGLLQWVFTGLTPSVSDNVLITYGDQQPDFLFEEIAKDYDNYYAAVDQLARLQLSGQAGEPADYRSVYEVDSRSGGRAVGFFYYAIIYGPIILLAIVAFFVGWLIWRKFRQGRSPK